MVRLLAIACAAVLFLGACEGVRGPDSERGVKVAPTLYPATFLLEWIGGVRAGIVELQPRGADAHDLELSAGQVQEMGEADLIVYAGGGFQPAVEDAAAGLPAERRFDILATEGLDLGGAGGSDGETEIDPHVWLDPEALTAIADALGDALAEIDPAGADTYRGNADALARDLTELDRDFVDGLAQCERREIVVAHSAFGYLAERYNLEEVAFAGLDPEAEPSPARLAEVTEFARDHGVTTIFYEAQTSPAAAQTVARELGLETSVLDPLETRPNNGDYLEAMRANLDNLRTALDCS